MSSPDRLEFIVDAALAAARDPASDSIERAEMLMELAMGLQQQPKTPDHLRQAVALYDEALSVCPASQELLSARIAARKATALQAIPDQGTSLLEQARAVLEDAIPDLARLGGPEELAEAEMNLGLVLQQLAGSGRAPIADAIAAYQRALRTFDLVRHPIEFAILQNNLAAAFLAMPATDERARIREALAVRCFEEGLKVVNLLDHPSEYAMLQNNLGNALQYAASSHALENNLRAMEAYDEALKVRTRETAPLAYANTLANKANCLRNLPDEALPAGDGDSLQRSRACYEEARAIFVDHGEFEKARLVAEALAALEQEVMTELNRTG
ncbi:MAG TPA: hypothetical protein VHG33_04755 [Woeseiaceae bacterium]|nr:hypothetical protein [Woeseiaceae bacterium]